MNDTSLKCGLGSNVTAHSAVATARHRQLTAVLSCRTLTGFLLRGYLSAEVPGLPCSQFLRMWSKGIRGTEGETAIRVELKRGLAFGQRELLSPRHHLSKELSLQSIMTSTLSKPTWHVSICPAVTTSRMSGMEVAYARQTVSGQTLFSKASFPSNYWPLVFMSVLTAATPLSLWPSDWLAAGTTVHVPVFPLNPGEARGDEACRGNIRLTASFSRTLLGV